LSAQIEALKAAGAASIFREKISGVRADCPQLAKLIRERTGEGRKRAMANGVKFGRKRKLSDYQRSEAIKRRAAGETLASIAKTYGVAISMISRTLTAWGCAI
jgi:hypothetical protein